MIVTAVQNWKLPTEIQQDGKPPVARIVTEIAPRPTAILHRIKQHRQFAETIAEIVRCAGGTPIMHEDI